MQRRPQTTTRFRALAAFAGTVVLAVLASASLLMPDVTVQSADSMPLLPSGLNQLVDTSFVE